MPVLTSDKLIDFAARLLRAGGASDDDAALVGKSLVGSNLRGHDSHGVMRIPFYLTQITKGELKPGGAFTIVNELPSILVVDGNWGFGQTQAQRLSRRIIDKALSAGVAVGTLIHVANVGRLGEYSEMAAAAGLVSMGMVNTHGFARRVAPPGGKVSRMGTNPIAIGVPHADGPGPLILDISTSATAEGKVRVKFIGGQPCPPGWLLDNEGRPTNDPKTLYAEPPGTILPMGGEQAYKGFGLGFMIEIFTGALSGGVCIREKPITQIGNCMFFMAMNPAVLGGTEHFASEVNQLAEFVRGCPRIDGVEEILLPGDPERKTLEQRSASGIPLDDGNWNELVKLAAKLNVAVPQTMSIASP